MFAGFQFSTAVILPIIAIMALGWRLAQRGILENNTVATMNHIVFHYALPSLLFFSVIKSKANFSDQWRLILVGYIAVLTLYFGATALARRYFPPMDRGVFVQGVYRANTAIVGLALVKAVYGDREELFAVAAIFTGAQSLLLNGLSVVVLTEHTGVSRQNRQLLLTLFRNPLIIAMVLAMAFHSTGLKMPQVFINFGDYLSNLTLPLALLCAGATFDWREISGAGTVAIWSTLGRVLVSPLVYLLVALALGFRGEYLGMLVLMAAAPAATASYIMAKAMPGNNAVAAANIIGLTNVASLLVMGLAISFFKLLGWA